MHGNAKDLTGEIFGRLKVISSTLGRDSRGQIMWRCYCKCGIFTFVSTSNLKRGNVISCGCFRRSRIGKASITHGRSGTPEYRIWDNAKQRCYNKNNANYKYYGGRGITVCDRWLKSFENFFEDMGKRPSSLHTIDRKDNNGNYEPYNCRWATRKQQARNKGKYRKKYKRTRIKL